jgi:asparagine N-glycosylation enzyme membrane subunit Stt3
MSPVVLSGFQPWMFGGLSAFALGCDALWARRRWGRSRARRVGSALLLAGGLLGLSAALLPELARGALDAWEWFAKQDEFQATVAESAPLLVARGRFTLEIAILRLSLFAPLLPLALVGGVWAVRRDRHRAPLLLFLGWTAGMLLAAVIQRRFFNSASLGVSLLLAWTVCGAYAALPPHWTAGRGGRVAAVSLLAAGVAFLLAPMLVGTYRVDLANQLRAFGDSGAEVSPGFVRRMVTIETARWLRKNTPETSGWMELGVRPEYGVLGPWPLGHILKWEARRPSVVDPFGDDTGPENFRLARRYTQASEPEAARILEGLGARYVIVQGHPAYLGEEPRSESMFVSLYFHDGTGYLPDGPGGRAPLVPALERHRLVFESRPVQVGDASEPSELKVFEFVEGARVSGRAAPHAAVEASVGLRSNRQREIDYVARTRADAEGRFDLRLPYATDDSPPAVRVAPAYVLRSGGRSGFLRVSDAQVRGGGLVEAPDLRPPAAEEGAAANPRP